MSTGLNDQDLVKVIKTLAKFDEIDSCFFFYQEDNTINIAVNCNDYFYWGCADYEEISASDLADIERFCNLCNSTGHSRFYGLFLWACWKRQELPQEPIFAKYTEERKELFKSVIKTEVEIS